MENMFSLLFNVVPEDENSVEEKDDELEETSNNEPKSQRDDDDPFDEISKDVGNKDIPIIE